MNTAPIDDPARGPATSEASEQLTVSISRDEDKHEALLTLTGEVDMATAPRLAETLNQLTDQGCQVVAVDLAAVTFLDSRGLAELISANQKLLRTGGHLHLRHPSRQVQRLLDMTGLTGEFRID